MKYTVVFSLLGLLCAFYAATVGSLWLRPIFASLALCWLGVGLAYAGIGGRIFGKSRAGRLSWWSILFWPFHLLNSALLWAFRQSKKEHTFDSISDNIYLGCQLKASDESDLAPHNIRGVLDLTCEFSEPLFLRRLNYLSIPILDTRAPSLKQLHEGANFLVKNAALGPVYVHCALGHGRSALFVAAYLLQSGQAKTAEQAIAMVRAKRPLISLHHVQLELLKGFPIE